MGSATNFPFGVSSFGIPAMGSVGGIPFGGNYWFVNEGSGADGNGGNSPSQSLKSISRALALATPNNNDVIFLSGTVHTTASINWNVNQTHLVGVTGPLKNGKRARISLLGGATGFNNLVNVTGNGCYFANFGTFYGFSNASAALVAWEDDGGRNCYDSVEFLGFGDGTTTTGSSNLTGSRAFRMNTNVGETTFRNCVFGVNTETRNATNYTVEIAGGAPRLTFENCDFESYLGGSGGASSHILIGAGGIDREMILNGCHFLNSVGAGATVMAQVFNVNGAPGGTVLLDSCTAYGATAWQTTPGTSIYMNMGAVSAPGGGISLVV